jgi:hypothetical protein
MSHFSVLVCLPAGTDPSELDDMLSEVMQPWDENREVDPWHDYLDGAPAEFWWVSSVRRGAEHHRDGTGIKPYNPKSPTYSSQETSKTPEQQRAEFAEDARWSGRLGESPTWQSVVTLYNERYPDDGDSERLNHDPESGRAYQISTRNPEAKWDYWRIGGRWGDYFKAKQSAPDLVFGPRGWDSPKATHVRQLRCDGGPIELLDFEATRDKKAREAHRRYDQWESICKDTPVAKAWSHFTGLVDLGDLEIDDARRDYHQQPRIRAAKDLTGWGSCPVEEFLSPREEYVSEARRGAVPGYALVTLEREWVAPGRMGWFGMSSDGPGERSGYHVAVNQYLDQVHPQTLLVALDCHI